MRQGLVLYRPERGDPHGSLVGAEAFTEVLPAQKTVRIEEGQHRGKKVAMKEVNMPDVSRISVQDARQEVTSGKALLVCAYEQEEKCNQVGLEGSISLTRFQERVPSLPKEQELIFFCA